MPLIRSKLPEDVTVLRDLSSLGGGVEYECDSSNYLKSIVLSNAFGVVPSLSEAVFLQSFKLEECKDVILPSFVSGLNDLVISRSSANIPCELDADSIVFFYASFPSGYDFGELEHARVNSLHFERCYFSTNKKYGSWEWMNSIPDAVRRLSSLKSLIIRQPNTSIPSWIGDLHSLETLSVASQVRCVPDNISELVNLRRLYLSGGFPSLPESFSKLSNLEELCLQVYSCSDKFDLTPISKLTNLKKLILYTDSIKFIPEFFKDFKSLNHLEIYSDNLESLKGIDCIPSLESLTVCVDDHFYSDKPCYHIGPPSLIGSSLGRYNTLRNDLDLVFNLSNLKELYTNNDYLLGKAKTKCLKSDHKSSFLVNPCWPDYEHQERAMHYGD